MSALLGLSLDFRGIGYRTDESALLYTFPGPAKVGFNFQRACLLAILWFILLVGIIAALSLFR